MTQDSFDAEIERRVREAVAEQDKRWHLDKRVPIAIIVTLLAQAAWFASYITRLEARINYTEAWMVEQRLRDDRQDRSAAEAAALLRSDLQYIRGQLDQLIRDGRGGEVRR
jgi:Tfp pilus assembly protein PilO